MNTGTLDQLEAALDETADITLILATVLGTSPTIRRTPAADRMIKKLLPDGRPRRMCVHATNPRPLFVTPVNPGFAVCSICLRCRFGSKGFARWARSRDCDGCGRDSEWLSEAVIVVGPVLLFGHLCDRCKAQG